ncbi:unnamed protein product, partial [Amoebophrya sp. A25]|eukprot:GSA25T00027351001.1
MLRRSDVEKDMRFLGLFLFANAVKSDSAGVIRQFQDASILPQIITGDNIYAAGSVAARCGFFDGESEQDLSTQVDQLMIQDADTFCDKQHQLDVLAIDVVNSSDGGKQPSTTSTRDAACGGRGADDSFDTVF